MEKKKKKKINHKKLFLIGNELSFLHYSCQGTVFFLTINPRGTDFVGDIMVSFCIRRLYMENDVTSNLLKNWMLKNKSDEKKRKS